MTLATRKNNGTTVRKDETPRTTRALADQLIKESEEIDKEYQEYVKTRKRTLLEMIFGGTHSD